MDMHINAGEGHGIIELAMLMLSTVILKMIYKRETKNWFTVICSQRKNAGYV